MALIVVGVSHRGAPLDVRERLAYRAARGAARRSSACAASRGAREAVLLSTCNRTELYVVEGEPDARAGACGRAVGERLGGDATRLRLRAARSRGRRAPLPRRVGHGLDGPRRGADPRAGARRVGGEPRRTRARCSTGCSRRRCSSAGACAARRRSAAARRSVSSAAVQLAKKIFGSLAGTRAMVLGAGEMAELALECLRREGVRAAIVANRTFERAQALAARHGATAMHYDECWTRARRRRRAALLDGVAACGRDASTRVRAGAGARAATGRSASSTSRCRATSIRRSASWTTSSSTTSTICAPWSRANLERRRAELPAAEQLIAEEVEKYWAVGGRPRRGPGGDASSATRWTACASAELAAALRRLGDLTPSERAAVEHFSQSLMNKFLHEPTVRLRAAAANGRGLGVVDAARYLFALDERRRRRATTARRNRRRTRLMPTGARHRRSRVHRLARRRRFLREGLDGARHRQPRRRASARTFPRARRFTSSTSATRTRRALVASAKLRRASCTSPRRSTCARASPIRCTTPASNILGTLNLLEAVRKQRARTTRVVFASTGGALYGDFNTPPNVEDVPKDPESPYAIAKLSVEHYLAYYAPRARARHRRAALRQRVRSAPGPARRGGRRRDLLRPHPRRTAADDLRRRHADARLRLRRRRGARRSVAARRSRCRRRPARRARVQRRHRRSRRRCVDLARRPARGGRHARCRSSTRRRGPASSRTRSSTSTRRERVLGWTPQRDARARGSRETLRVVRRARPRRRARRLIALHDPRCSRRRRRSHRRRWSWSLNASTETQVVLGILVVLSLVSWAIMFGEVARARSALRDATAFVREFERAPRARRSGGARAKRSTPNAFAAAVRARAAVPRRHARRCRRTATARGAMRTATHAAARRSRRCASCSTPRRSRSATGSAASSRGSRRSAR